MAELSDIDPAAAAAALVTERYPVHGPGWVWQPSALLEAPGWHSAVQHNPVTREVLRGGGVALTNTLGVSLLWSPGADLRDWDRVLEALTLATAAGWDAAEIVAHLGTSSVV